MSCKRASLSIRVLLGNLNGVRLPGLLREINSISEYISWTRRLFRFKALASLLHIYLGSFFLDPEVIRKLSIGAIWNFVKETGLL